MVTLKGQTKVEELSRYLSSESPRCAVIVAAAYFDETLGSLLVDKNERSFFVRLKDALDWGILTQHEHDDLQALRQMRNDFAHKLRVKKFDSTSRAAVNDMNIWQTASQAYPLRRILRSTLSKLLYVVGTIAFRLQRRSKPAVRSGPRPEPQLHESNEWPPVISI